MTPALPGLIPGLLRRCSPVVTTEELDSGISQLDVLPAGCRGVILWLDSECAEVALCDARGEPWGLMRVELSALSLDLADPAGRAHAAWWVMPRTRGCTMRLSDISIITRAAYGDLMSDAEIDDLRRVCLHVAGLTP
jgi:hypothetical protein